MLFELPIVFHSHGVPLVGRIFRNTSSLQERQPAVITMGSWLTVKEQMATTYWLTFDGLSAARRVSTPTMLVHSDACVFPDHVRQVHAQLTGPKELVWARGNQIDFYDQPEQVETAVRAATSLFDRTLRD